MAFTSDAIAAQQVQEKLNTLYATIQEVERKRQQSEDGINAITDLEDEKVYSQSKLKSLYKLALNHAEREEDLLRQALQKIADIRAIKNERRIKTRLVGNKEIMRKTSWMRMLQNHADTLPLFVGKLGERAPPLCGAIPPESNYIAKVGDMIATLVKTNDGEDWILAEVVSYNYTTGKYEVDDILEEQNHKKRLTINRKYAVPMPLMRANPETNPEALFSQGAIVLALYPQTSCLYIAVVCRVPMTHMEEYEVLFYDPNYPEGYSPPMKVAQRYMIAFKQKYKS